eukprot:COSAG01_NODE_34464_length_547_cov_0.919643_1_plen_79_part_01
MLQCHWLHHIAGCARRRGGSHVVDVQLYGKRAFVRDFQTGSSGWQWAERNQLACCLQAGLQAGRQIAAACGTAPVRRQH